MKEINVVLFDLDGTLVDSNQLLIDSFQFTFKHFFPAINFQRKDYIKMIGPTLEETFSQHQNDMLEVNKMIHFFRKFYKDKEYQSIEIYPNLLKTLQTLKEMNIQTGIVTTKFKESAIPSIEFFNLDKYIDIYVYLDDVDNPKPNAEPIQYAKTLLNNPKEMIIIGDNPSDIYSGKNADILTCGVDWSLKKDELRASNPDFWLYDFSGLVPIINKYNEEVK